MGPIGWGRPLVSYLPLSKLSFFHLNTGLIKPSRTSFFDTELVYLTRLD